ncbi:unnamed protein product [Soboliphyme baturini]|uniref:Protein kinase domain-containing protein n=1 Tax=Soboliphyme baturini TaxID=241478 RepID=A0A183IVJ3_9BILA|nr:unnamed protein product [Soboliphyme baturini]
MYCTKNAHSLACSFIYELHGELLYRQLAAAVEVDRTHIDLDLPTEVDSYADLVPLEPKPGYFGLISTVYKAVSIKDGLCYCLRRFHANKRCIFAVETWKKIKHANIVQLREAFMTRAFGDNSLVIVYDYHGGAETLKYRHFSDAGCRSPNGISGIDHANEPLPEALLWSYVVDLSSALRTIHSSGLAARTIDPSKILVLGKSFKAILISYCIFFR